MVNDAVTEILEGYEEMSVLIRKLNTGAVATSSPYPVLFSTQIFNNVCQNIG